MEKQKCPELRFNGFSEDWEQSNFLDNIQSIIDFRGRTPKKLGMDWSKDGYLALSALNVKNGYIDPKIDAHYGDEKLYQKWMAGNELKKGQVLFTTEAPMGNVAQVPDDRGYILSQRTIAFNVKANKISDDFLAVLLGSIMNIGFERDNFALMLRPWYRISEDSSDDNNADIDDYVGRGDLTAFYRWNEHDFSLMLRHSLQGGSDSHGAMQFDWAFPISGKLRGHFQLFDGYGESLIDYNHRATYAGLGVSLLNWF